jgi:hypothetical protein
MRAFKLLIGLAQYTVKFKKKVIIQGQAVEGVCMLDSKKIIVDSGSSPDVQFTTFWHEWCHAVLHELGANELAENEQFVESLSQNIARTIRHMPADIK